jgi:hypothetical protein
LEKIREGEIGEIYLAEDKKLRRKGSLKFLAGDLTRDEDRKDRCIRRPGRR